MKEFLYRRTTESRNAYLAKMKYREAHFTVDITDDVYVKNAKFDLEIVVNTCITNQVFDGSWSESIETKQEK